MFKTQSYVFWFQRKDFTELMIESLLFIKAAFKPFLVQKLP